MKALTLWQPWASLVAIGAKPYEFRGWEAPASVIGQRMAVHASVRPIKLREVDALLHGLRTGEPIALRRELAIDVLEKMSARAGLAPYGHIVATAVLKRCVRADAILNEFGIEGAPLNDSDREFHFNFAWHLVDIERVMPPVPATGRQGLWEWTP